uniref:uncharacterized protein LOC124054856 n=1 Tax=Scatophagus argus TaxID=75038 RepID=UPI001ED7F53D|nr:uncharacterized protein LOC124054856 [Scatophagus argus]XP_046237246.1 uncharacterized protein LOC124054856 [Scatophagus argus]
MMTNHTPRLVSMLEASKEMNGKHKRDNGLQNDAEFQTQTQPPGLHFGLRNQGATCYLNSVLQVLSMTTEIHDRLDPESQTIDGELRNLFRNLTETTGRTENITRCLEIKNVHQQRNAAECLEMILRKVSPKASEVFQGQLQYTTKCCRGHSINEETNPFWTLPLSMKDAHDTTYSVEENLERIFRTTSFTGDNMVFCNECERKTDATSGCEMVEAPQVLIILLKRFYFDYNTRSHFKSDRRVDVPLTLQMKKKKYKLYGTVNHMGGLRGGHYTANILSSEDNTWYECDDTQVTKAGGQPFENHVYSSSTAYLLMYRATECQTPTETKPGDEVKEQQGEGAESVKNDKPVRETSQDANETTDLDCSGCDRAQEDGTRSSITGQNSESEDRTAGGDSKGLWNRLKAAFVPKAKPKKDAVTEGQTPTETKPGDEVKEQQGEGLKQVKRGAKRKAKANKGASDDEGNTNKEDEGQMKGETLGPQEARGEEGGAESVRNDKPVRETSQDANEKTDVNCATLGLQNDAEFQTQTQPPGLHFGLRNQGATCYLNSVLQVLSMTTEIHDRLDPESQTIDGELRILFRNLTETTGRTENITRCLEIKNVHQQRDAAECLEMILRKVSPKASEVFQGQLQYTTKCCRGHSINEETNPFWTLPLSLKDAHDTAYSVEENLERIFHTKSFTGDNMVFCDECERKTDATSGCEMVEAPQVLIILLKRFDFDYNTRSHFKSDRRVDVPFALQMKKKKYKLYGTVNHMGGLGGGHYTANILSSEDNTWYKCDDTQVTKTRGQPFENHVYSSSTAYLLMYRATECQTPTETKPGDEVKEQQGEGAESVKNDKPVRETSQDANETTDLDCSGCDRAQEDGTRSSIMGQNSESEDRTAGGDSKGMNSPKQLWNKLKAAFELKAKPKKDAVTEFQTPTETKPGDEVKEQQGEGLKQVKRGAKHKAKANKGASDDEGNTNKEDERQMKGETLGPQEARGEEGGAESVRNDKPVRETSQDANETTDVNCATLGEAKGSSGCEKAPEFETQSYITLESSEPELLTETAL